MYGESNWKAEEEYRQGVKEFSPTHGSEKPVREAGEETAEEEEGSRSGKSRGEDDSEW